MLKLLSMDNGIDSDFNNGVNITTITPDNLPIEFVKQYLRVEHDFDDIEIQLMINSAQSYVRNFLKIPREESLEDSELVIPMLTLVAYFYENKTVTMKSNEKINLMFESILGLHRREVL